MFRVYRRPESAHWWVSFSAGGHRIRRSMRTTEREVALELAASQYRAALKGEAPERPAGAVAKRRSG